MLGDIRQKRQRLHDFTLHAKSKKTKEQTKQNKNRLIVTEIQ